MMKIGILTSGGDCPGLNAALRGATTAIRERMPGAEIIGIENGFSGLTEGHSRVLGHEDLSGLLTRGGTILGTRRTPYKTASLLAEEENDAAIAAMRDACNALGLNCLLVLGGHGTHRTALKLAQAGVNILALPKTIDNDVYGTDVSFGFQTAVETATEQIDRLHTTAASHGRVMVIELMGHHAGWLALHAGLAGGANVILLPEIPYSYETVSKAVSARAKAGKAFSIIVIAEGAMTQDEFRMAKEERAQQRKKDGFSYISLKLAEDITSRTGFETRAVIPGHILRGGTPCAFDRILATKMGVAAAKLIAEGCFGKTVALCNHDIVLNDLEVAAGKIKTVPLDDNMLNTARYMGICLGV